MKLHATMVPYNGTVGGNAIDLVDEKGAVHFVVKVLRTSLHPNNSQVAAIASALVKGIPDGIELLDKAGT